MTNEEALKVLKYRSGWNLSIRDVNALDMAIKALERESQTFEWCHDCSEYDHDKHCCPRYNGVIRNAVEEMKQEAYEDAIAVREFGLDDFIEFGKKAFGVELTFKKSDDPDTYEKLFGTSQEAKTGHWIPVSERLPKDDKDVLVCDSQGAMEVCYYHVDDNVYPTEFADLNETGWYNEHDDVLYFEPIAWMPLPEPYKPQESEEQTE